MSLSKNEYQNTKLSYCPCIWTQEKTQWRGTTCRRNKILKICYIKYLHYHIKYLNCIFFSFFNVIHCISISVILYCTCIFPNFLSLSLSLFSLHGFIWTCLTVNSWDCNWVENELGPSFLQTWTLPPSSGVINIIIPHHIHQ